MSKTDCKYSTGFSVKLFNFHPHTLFVNGGGETMVSNTLKQLSNKNINAELFDINKRTADFDLFHLFGSNNAVSELYTSLSGQKKTLVVSAIDFLDMPYIKLILLKYFQKICPFENTYKYRQNLFNYADVIIANSNAEKQFLLDYFFIEKDKIEVVPVGVSSKFYNNKTKSFTEKYNINNYILSVGRINSRKGQIKIINALNKLDKNIVFIGREDPSELEYFNDFKMLVNRHSNVYWIGQLDNGSDLLVSAYSNALLHIAPSNPPEFPGISSMEAGIAGIKVITTKSPPVVETFNDLVDYCEATEESIYTTVVNALDKDTNNKLRDHMYKNFIWENIADKIISIYQNIYKKYKTNQGGI